MDKLKPILEQKFWVLAGLSIILSPIGWWISTNNIAKTTDTRIKAIKGKDDTAKRLANPSVRHANKTWIAEAAKVKTELTGLVNDTHRSLYNRQREKMVWEPLVQEALTKAGVKSRNDKEDPREFLNAQSFFVATYDDAWKRVIDIIDPFDWYKGDGKVLLDQTEGSITKKAIATWQLTMVFTKKEMWDVEEDLWLTKEVMEAIARVNQGATQISDAHIKKLTQLVFRGGDRTDLAARKTGVAKDQAANGVASTLTAQRGGGGMHTGNIMDAGAGQEAQVRYTPPKEFDPDDVFGADGSSASSGDARRDKKDGMATVTLKRYAEFQEQKWSKRAFVLRVVMDQRQIPTLVAELTASAFPVEIKHVEHTEYDNYKDLQLFNGGRGASPASNGQSGSDATATEEDRQQKIKERIQSVLNQNYLADVIIAGQFTIYEDPAQDGSSPAKPAGQPAGAVDPKAMAAATGQNAGTAGKTESAPGAPPPAGKSPPPVGKSPPAAGTGKSGSDVKPPAAASTANGAKPAAAAKSAAKSPQAPGK